MPICAIVCFLLATATTAFTTAPTTQTFPAILIHRTEPTVRRIMFDPKSAPDDMPTLNAHESAITQYRFDCRLSAQIQTTSHHEDGIWQISAKILSLKIDLAMEDRIYLPWNVTLALRSHEEGHREINEEIYASFAEAAVKELAAGASAHEWTTSGKSSPDELSKVLTAMIERDLSRQIRDAFIGLAKRANERFDEITEHGRGDVAVSDAVRQALK